MTLWDSMSLVLGFFGSPAAVAILGVVMLAAIVVAAMIWDEYRNFSGRWFWLTIPVAFLAASLIIWGCSSADAYEWVSRQ